MPWKTATGCLPGHLPDAARKRRSSRASLPGHLRVGLSCSRGVWKMPWKTANTTKVSSSAVVTGTQKRLHVVPARRLQSRPCSAVTTARARHSSHPMVALLASRLHTGFQCKHSHRARSARDCARGRTILITQMLWIKSYRLQLFLHAPPCAAQPIAVERQEQGGQAAHFRETDDSGLQISCALCHTFRAELSQERRRLLRTIVHVFVCFQVRVITGRSVFSGGG